MFHSPLASLQVPYLTLGACRSSGPAGAGLPTSLTPREKSWVATGVGTRLGRGKENPRKIVFFVGDFFLGGGLPCLRHAQTKKTERHKMSQRHQKYQTTRLDEFT